MGNVLCKFYSGPFEAVIDERAYIGQAVGDERTQLVQLWCHRLLLVAQELLGNVYVANGDSMLERTGKGKAGGLYAIRMSDGQVAWSAPSSAASCAGKPGCTSAQNQAVTVVPGLVFSGAMDGHLRAYSAEEGRIVWDFDTNVDFQTVNGVPAHGGSFGSSGTVILGNRMFVGSGYGALGVPGNVLLAFQIVP